jgi:hypothetical protein
MADKRPKPDKPYPDFPLNAHANGQWSKKIRSKVYFFGVWDDPAAALQKYVEQRDDLQAGRQPRRLSGNKLTVGQLCNQFLYAKESRVETGELERRTFQGYHKTCETLIQRLGKGRLVEDLRPIDFDSLRMALAKDKSPNSISNEVIRVRIIFKYGYDAALIE